MNALAFVLALILAAPQLFAAAAVNDSPAVAASDDNFLAVWSSRSATSDPSLVIAAPFDRSGAPQGGATVIGSSLSAPSLAWTGHDYLVALRAVDGVQIRHLAKNGMPLGT